MRIISFCCSHLLSLFASAQLTINNISSTDQKIKELFVGVDNHIAISGTKARVTRLTASHGEIMQMESNQFSIRVSSSQPDTIKIYRDGRLSLLQIFSVVNIPQPIVRLGNSIDTVLSVSQIRYNPFLSVMLLNCRYKHDYYIFSFQARIITASGDTAMVTDGIGGRYLPKPLLAEIEKLHSADQITFERIVGTCPDCRNIRFLDLHVIIK